MRRSNCTWTLLLPALALACVVLGCGPSTPATVPVSGTVTLDGNPLDGAAVNFTPVGPGQNATGQTDSTGKFTLTTFKPGDGAPAGKYKVGVSKLEKEADVKADPSKPAAGGPPEGVQLSGPPIQQGAPPAQPKSLVPTKYINPNESGITVEVKKGMEPVKIELKSN